MKLVFTPPPVNRDAFAADPEKYAPQYGGFCAWAVAQGYTASIDREAWKIVGGKLYLNYSKSVQAQWAEDFPGNIKEADGNWPGIRAKLTVMPHHRILQHQDRQIHDR